MRAVRGERSVISSCDKRRNSEHVGRTGAMSEGRIRRAGKVHDTRCVHIPSRQAGEGEDGQRRAQRDSTCCGKRKNSEHVRTGALNKRSMLASRREARHTVSTHTKQAGR